MSRTVLITGANAGLGFESAAQFAALGDTVVISARSQAKADDAVKRLVERTGRAEAFGTAIFDNNQPDTVRAAVAALADKGLRFDAVVLNAGGIATPHADGTAPLTGQGFSKMYGMNIHGHIVLVDALHHAGLLVEGATIMLAGTEASRGIGAMRIAAPVLPEGYGDLDATLQAIVSGQTGQAKGYDPMDDYAMVKLIGTVWIRQLAQDHGYRALTVSPGFTGGTEAMKNLPTFQRLMFSWVALPVMKLLGNAHHVDVGAARYVQAVTDGGLRPGGYYASPNGGISGDIAEQGTEAQPLLASDDFDAAVRRLVASHVGAPRLQAVS